MPLSLKLPIHGKELSCGHPVDLEVDLPLPVPAYENHIIGKICPFCLFDVPQIRIVTQQTPHNNPKLVCKNQRM